MQDSISKYLRHLLWTLTVGVFCTASVSGQVDFRLLLKIRDLTKSNSKVTPPTRPGGKRIETRAARTRAGASKRGFAEMLKIAATALDRNDFVGAGSLYKRLVASRPRDVRGYWGLGNVAYYQGCYDEAIKNYQVTRTLDQKNSIHLYNLGVGYYAKGNYEIAADYLEKALKSRPGDLDAKLKLAETYIELEEIETAELLLEQALSQEPNSYRAIKSLSDLFVDQGKYADALSLFEPFTDGPNSADRAVTYEALALIEKSAGNTSKAIDHFRRAIKDNPEEAGRYYFEIGLLTMSQSFQGLQAKLNSLASIAEYAENNQFGPAEEYLRKAIARNYNEPEAYYFLGILVTLQFRSEEGESEIQKGLSIEMERQRTRSQSDKPQCQTVAEVECARCNEAIGKYFLGTNYYLRGIWFNDHPDEAEPLFQQSLTILKDAVSLGTAVNPGLYQLLSRVYASKEDYGRAITYGELALLNLRRCPDCFSNDYTFYTGLGEAYLERSRYSEAAAMLKKAIRINPAYPDAHLNLGDVYERQNRLSDAYNEFRETISLDPKRSWARLHLGIVLTKLGDKAGAREQYDALLDLDENSAKVLLQTINKAFPVN